MRKLSLTLALIALAVLPAQAAASHLSDRPDNSGISQYVEDVPGGGGGDNASGGGGGAAGGGGGSGSAYSEGAGFSGSLFAKTSAGPGSPGEGVQGSSGGAGGTAGSAAASSDESAGGSDDDGWSLSDVVGTTLGGESSGGMGIALPIILGAVLLATVLLLLATRRRRGKRQIEQA